MPYLLEKSRFGISFFAKRNTILLLYMYQVFISLQDHLHFFLHFFFTFMEQFFLDDPIYISFVLQGHQTQMPDKVKLLLQKYWYRVIQKKLFHKREEKMQEKMKMILQKNENLVHVQQQYGVSFCEKIDSKSGFS